MHSYNSYMESLFVNELSKCVRCAGCKANCPTYDEDSTESMGARGRIALLGAFSSGKIKPSAILNDTIFSCTLCGACAGLCPPGVDIKEVIYHGRRLLKKTDKKRKYLRFFTNFYTKRPQLSFKLLSLTQHFLFPYLHKKGILSFRPELPERLFKDDHHVYTVSKKKGRIAIFTGCAVNFLFPHLGETLISVLHRLGYEVILPVGEVCCGIPLRSLGLEEEARELAKKNCGIFSKLNVEAVLSLCPTCTLAMKIDYPKLIGEGINNAMDISEFFTEKTGLSFFTYPVSDLTKVIYHDPCHLKYGLGVTKEPRKIIEHIGLDLLKTTGEKCCGFAGTFCLSYRDLSKSLLMKCVKEYSETAAEAVVTSCPGCMIQLSKESSDKPVLHLIEVIEDAMIPKN
ncbi:MAG: (Fe-S)-binding protein [Nitrospira sp.]|nr:(Fe-S)-binding protein [Nitrospira sp.]